MFDPMLAILFVIPVFHAFPRHVSDYLKVQERDPKAHKFLGQLYEREGDINRAVGCYKVKRTSQWKHFSLKSESECGSRNHKIQV